jgi:hypothetical protein
MMAVGKLVEEGRKFFFCQRGPYKKGRRNTAMIAYMLGHKDGTKMGC